MEGGAGAAQEDEVVRLIWLSYNTVRTSLTKL